MMDACRESDRFLLTTTCWMAAVALVTACGGSSDDRPANEPPAVEAAAAEAVAEAQPAPEDGMQRIQIEVGSFRFDALAAGPEGGPLVIMLHGFPQSSYEFRGQIPVLAEMGFRVVAPDQRGYSPGARPSGVAAYAIPELVADVIGMADALGRESFHLVGHDWGAAVAWFAALSYPDRVESLVPISVPHPFAFAEALQNPTGQQSQMSGYMQMFASDSAAAMLLADDAARLRGVYAGAGLSDQEVQVYVNLLGSEEAIQAALHWYGAMSLGGSSADYTPIGMPTMYVWSTADMALGREGAELTEKYVEGPYRFEVLEGVSHWVPEEAPDALNDLLRAHFAPYVGG